jgi:hypothetical protein
MPFHPRFPRCPVCNEHVVVNTARIDESGQALHEDCYVLTLKKRPSKINRTPLSPSPEFLRFIAMN